MSRKKNKNTASEKENVQLDLQIEDQEIDDESKEKVIPATSERIEVQLTLDLDE